MPLKNPMTWPNAGTFWEREGEGDEADAVCSRASAKLAVSPLALPAPCLAAALGAPERDAEQPSVPCAPQLSVPAPAEGSGGNGGARAARPQTLNGA